MNYWYLTIREIRAILNDYVEKEQIRAKEITATSYNIAQLTAAFVGSVIAGKQIPKIEELYPSFASDKPEEPKMSEEEKQAIIMGEKLKEFAKKHNEQRRKALANDNRRT